LSDIFSRRLASVSIGGGGAGLHPFPVGVAPGVCSVLYMSAWWNVAAGVLGQGFAVLDEAGKLVWEVRHPFFMAGRVYRWVGRDVVDAGVDWTLDLGSSPLELRVAGFQFTS
jgi:hypothetical protein